MERRQSSTSLARGLGVMYKGWILPLALVVGCSSVAEEPTAHQRLKDLPSQMEEWARYLERTGETAEGAAGFLYTTTMSQVARSGDSDWGNILDDPEIPHEYKIRMIFEIVQCRLGKGSGWAPYHTPVVILPISGQVESWDEVHHLLRQALDHAEQ